MIRNAFFLERISPPENTPGEDIHNPTSRSEGRHVVQRQLGIPFNPVPLRNRGPTHTAITDKLIPLTILFQITNFLSFYDVVAFVGWKRQENLSLFSLSNPERSSFKCAYFK